MEEQVKSPSGNRELDSALGMARLGGWAEREEDDLGEDGTANGVPILRKFSGLSAGTNGANGANGANGNGGGSVQEGDDFFSDRQDSWAAKLERLVQSEIENRVSHYGHIDDARIRKLGLELDEKERHIEELSHRVEVLLENQQQLQSERQVKQQVQRESTAQEKERKHEMDHFVAKQGKELEQRLQTLTQQYLTYKQEMAAQLQQSKGDLEEKDRRIEELKEKSQSHDKVCAWSFDCRACLPFVPVCFICIFVFSCAHLGGWGLRWGFVVLTLCMRRKRWR